MQKLSALIVLMLLTHSIAYTQQKSDVFYLYQSDWSPTNDVKEASYFMQVVSENDTTFFCRYYQKTGPMVKQECFKDGGLTVPNGVFIWYNTNGWMDSSGTVKNGIKDGWWYKYDDTAAVIRKTYYADAKKIKTIDYLLKKEIYPDGIVKEIEEQKDTSKEEHIMVGASYPGGAKGWTKYLMKNLVTPERFQNIIRNGAGNVVISFLVNKEGNPAELTILKSCEWSADAEVFRIIKAGGKWAPATIDGTKVIYRQKQSITFQVNGG